MKRELRPHQHHAMQLLKRSLGSGKRRPILQAPTGFGKTVLAAAIVEGARRKNKRIIFAVPALSLINQTVRSFYDEGIYDVGVIQGDHELTDPAKPIQVASVQTLQNRKIPHADVVVIDECHRMFKFYEKWFSEWDQTPFIGLTATPWSKGLGKYYDDLQIAITTQELIDQGYLSDFRVYAPSKPDLSKCRTVAGDWHEGDLAEAMDQKTIISDVVSNWLKHGERRPTLCFAVNRAHANHLKNDFQAQGVRAAYIDAYTDGDERDEIGRQLATGEVEVVCNVGCLTTGIDWDVRCIILARPTKSEILFTQIIGRGLRTAPGKTNCVIFDHSDTHQRLGFVTDIHHDELDDGKPKKSSSTEREKPLPKDCQSCGFLKPAKTHQCPSCGFKPEKQTDIEVVDGELAEMRRKKKMNRELSTDEKRAFYAELQRYGIDKGYKKGWASNKYREKFGVWPNAHADVKPAENISHQTQDFITHTQIKFVKKKAASA